MIKRIFAIFLALILSVSIVACGEGEETTITGMVVSVDGTKISLMEMDSANRGPGNGQFQMPEGMEGFENFNPEDFTMPKGGANMPQWGNGERPAMPEGSTMPEDFTMPEGYTMPEDFTMPEGMGGMMPGNGGMPSFGGNGGARPDSGEMNFEGEIKTVDVANAHISIQIENGKEGGSLSDIKAGSFVTVTLNAKGEATYVLITSQSSFGGNRNPRN